MTRQVFIAEPDPKLPITLEIGHHNLSLSTAKILASDKVRIVRVTVEIEGPEVSMLLTAPGSNSNAVDELMLFALPFRRDLSVERCNCDAGPVLQHDAGCASLKESGR